MHLQHVQGNSDGIKDRILDSINVPDSCSVLNNEERTNNNETNSIDQISDSDSLHCAREDLTFNELTDRSTKSVQNVCSNESILTCSDKIEDSDLQINSKG